MQSFPDWRRALSMSSPAMFDGSGSMESSRVHTGRRFEVIPMLSGESYVDICCIETPIMTRFSPQNLMKLPNVHFIVFSKGFQMDSTLSTVTRCLLCLVKCPSGMQMRICLWARELLSRFVDCVDLIKKNQMTCGWLTRSQVQKCAAQKHLRNPQIFASDGTAFWKL